MRTTKQQKLILKIINESFSHPTAYDIYIECKKNIPNISLGTVYRNLNLLVSEFKIKRLKMPDNVDRFDKMLKHSHFVCIKCYKVVDVFSNYLENIDSIDNNKVLDCEITFKGICSDCKERKDK